MGKCRAIQNFQRSTTEKYYLSSLLEHSTNSYMPKSFSSLVPVFAVLSKCLKLQVAQNQNVSPTQLLEFSRGFFLVFLSCRRGDCLFFKFPDES